MGIQEAPLLGVHRKLMGGVGHHRFLFGFPSLVELSKGTVKLMTNSISNNGFKRAADPWPLAMNPKTHLGQGFRILGALGLELIYIISKIEMHLVKEIVVPCKQPISV